MKLEKIPQEKLHGPRLPARASIDEQAVLDLAESIQALGLLQPLLVAPQGDAFEVVAGHRRLLATRQIGMDPVPCLVLDSEDEGDTLAARLHENIYRQDLTAIEEAAVYAEIFDKVEDIDAVARLVHRSRAVVERRLALLAGDAAIRDAVHSRQISAGVGEQLNRVEDETTRHYLLEFAIKDGASVEKVRGWRKSYEGVKLSEAQQEQPPDGGDPTVRDVPDPNICWLCGSSEEQHDLRVRMVHQTCERIARSNMQRAAAERGANGET